MEKLEVSVWPHVARFEEHITHTNTHLCVLCCGRLHLSFHYAKMTLGQAALLCRRLLQSDWPASCLMTNWLIFFIFSIYTLFTKHDQSHTLISHIIYPQDVLILAGFSPFTPPILWQCVCTPANTHIRTWKDSASTSGVYLVVCVCALGCWVYEKWARVWVLW